MSRVVILERQMARFLRNPVSVRGAAIVIVTIALVGSVRVDVPISLVVALSLVVVVDLSYPFSGSLVVSSDPFQTGVLAQFFHK